MEQVKQYLELIEKGEYDKFLNKVFNDLDVINIFLKTDYIIYVFMSMNCLYDNRIEELNEWMKSNNISKEILKQIKLLFNNYAFEQGKYNLLYLDELEKNKLNQVLILNKKPSLDPLFNKFLNQYKKTDIKILNLNMLINRRYFNYRYNSLPSFVVNDKDIILKDYELINGTIINQTIKNECDEIGESFYMTNSGFSRNPIFKRLCGILYLYLSTNKNNFISFNDILNVIISYEFLQYSRTIHRNDLISKEGGLITYITFKSEGKNLESSTSQEKLNYRYQQSIEWLRNPSKDRLEYTKINDDEKGLYISTNWDMKGYEELLKTFIYKDYEKMLYLCFNLQYLTRGTCYYSILIYCVMTGQIPKDLDLIDLYAISHSLEEFKEYIKNKFVKYEIKNKIETLTYENVLNQF